MIPRRPPHRFFRGNEGHPRPRCFNIHEVKPHPSLWETMTGLWKGKDKKSLMPRTVNGTGHTGSWAFLFIREIFF